jgi:transposase-like protein
MEHKLEIRQMFSEPFKRKVIEEYLSTGCSKMSLLKKYDIHFKSAIQTWMHKLGYTDGYRRQKLTFAPINIMSLPTDNTDKISNSDLQKKVKELERQLEDEKLRSEAYVRIIEKAEKELNIPIRKKPNTK